MRSIPVVARPRMLLAAIGAGLAIFACSGENPVPDQDNTGGASGQAGNRNAAGEAIEAGQAGSERAGQAGSDAGRAGQDGSSAGGTSNPTEAGQAGAAKSGAAGAAHCASSTTTAKSTQANLLFVLDRSGSMQCNPPDGDEELNLRCKTTPAKQDTSLPSKWEVTTSALTEALQNLTALPNVSAGVTLFPKPDFQNECLVADEPDLMIDRLDDSQLEAIELFLDGVEPSGETPIGGATILSYQYLSQQLRERELFGSTFVVLLTDGTETCDGQQVLDQLVETDVSNATLFNIRTFVIGAPGSEDARGFLSQVAFEGMTAADDSCDHSGDAANVGNCHFDMTGTEDFAGELSEALEAISDQRELSCEFEVPKNPKGGGVDLEEVNVTFTPSSESVIEIPQDETMACDEGAEGWQYSEDFEVIRLCGEVCQTVKHDPDGQVDIVLGCPTVKTPEVPEVT